MGRGLTKVQQIQFGKSKQNVEIEKKIKKVRDNKKIRRTLSIKNTILESNFFPVQKQQRILINDQQIKISKAMKVTKVKKQTKKIKFAKKQQNNIKQNQQKPVKQNQKQKLIKRTSSFEGINFSKKKKEKFINQEILNEKTHQLDEFYKVKEKFLGKEGNFEKYKVLIGYLSGGSVQSEYCGGFNAFPGAELKKRGFQFDKVYNLNDLNNKILDYDIVWILSFTNTAKQNDQQIFVEKIGEYMKAKKSLFLWSDKQPVCWESDLILNKYFNGMHCINHMFGNYNYENIITKSKLSNFMFQSESESRGKFDVNNQFFYGVNNWYDGITISHPVNIHPDFKVIAHNRNNEPLVLVAEENENHGRIILDTGFTKMYRERWEKAGTDQYFSNANVWLTGIPD